MKYDEYFGNLVEVETGKEIFEGTMLPSPEEGYFLLKLANGYNIGFVKKEVLNVKLIKKNKLNKESFEVPFSSEKRNVALVILGGTIAARLNPGKGGVDFVESSNDLFNYYPDLFNEVNVTKVEVPFMKGSENMDYKDWQRIAKIVAELVNDKDISGVIVTQGTDTLHYSSAALSFFLRELGKPVVLTFSQRSIDRGSSDANLNLLCSAKLASSDFSGVYVVGHENSNDETCFGILGTKVRKLHSSKRDAFKPVNFLPSFRIGKNIFEKLTDVLPREDGKKCKLDAKFEEKIGLVKFYPGQNPEILDYYLEKGYKAIVLEMFGLGQIATSGARLSWTRKLKEVQEKGLIICATAQTIYGRLNPLVYVTGRELLKTGIIFLEDMLSEIAFVKLGWVLGHKDWNVREKMLENFAFEINSRLVE